MYPVSSIVRLSSVSGVGIVNISRITLAVVSIVMCELTVAGPVAARPAAPDSATTVCWYTQPAKAWDQALPLGNGRLGAMVFGDPARQRILLNEETVWTGGPYQPANTAGARHLPEIRRLVFAGNWALAHRLFGRYMMGYPVEQQKYQPLGNLWLEWPGHETATDYRRSLDLDAAVATDT